MAPMVRDAMQGEVAPERPHLAVHLKDGSWFPIPEGATLAVIMDPSTIHGILPLRLVRVSLKSIWLKCGCGKPDCTRTYVWQTKRAGFHPDYNEGRGRVKMEEPLKR